MLLNPKDVAYGQFLLDEKSRDHLQAGVQRIRDPLLRAVAMSALYATLREGEMAPWHYAETVVRLLEKESDPETHSWLLSTFSTSVFRYMNAERRTPFMDQMSELLLRQLAGDNGAIKLNSLRFLAGSSNHSAALELCQQVVEGKEDAVPGLKVGLRDRFLMAAALLAAGQGREGIDRLQKAAGKTDVAKQVFMAGAASPDPKVKVEYFKAYLSPDEPPEQWTSGSLGYFHWPGQEEITLPYLRKALDQVEWVKKNRKVFFMPAWLDAFVNGHSSKEALEIVREFMKEREDLSLDIRRKLLQSVDGLERAVKIKERWQ